MDRPCGPCAFVFFFVLFQNKYSGTFNLIRIISKVSFRGVSLDFLSLPKKQMQKSTQAVGGSVIYVSFCCEKLLFFFFFFFFFLSNNLNF